MGKPHPFGVQAVFLSYPIATPSTVRAVLDGAANCQMANCTRRKLFKEVGGSTFLLVMMTSIVMVSGRVWRVQALRAHLRPPRCIVLCHGEFLRL